MKDVDTTVLSEDQRAVWDALVAGENLFVTARAGAGKSFLINFIKENFNGLVITTASTGIAANNVGGRTLHSQFLINPNSLDSEASANKLYSSKRGYAIRKARLLIIDEISMVSDALLECVSDICALLRNPLKPFGGLQVAFFGDFLQLPPVFKGVTANDRICWDCGCWTAAHVRTILMTSNFRQATDKAFFNLLTRLRYNHLTQADIDKIYSRDLPAGDSAVRIFSTNDEVGRYNKVKYDALDKSTEHTYWAATFGNESAVRGYWKDSLIPERLDLRLGARVMMCKNKDVGSGYLFNGSLGEVVDFNALNDPVVKFDSGITYTVERECVFELTEKTPDGRSYIEAQIYQHPLRLAWACTVHKSQGQTFDSIFVDCSRVFLYGQVYVAFSRARTLDGLFVSGFNPQSKGAFSDPLIAARYEVMEQEAFERKMYPDG